MVSTASYCSAHVEERRAAAHERERRGRAENRAQQRAADLVDLIVAGLAEDPGPEVSLDLVTRIAGRIARCRRLTAAQIAKALGVDLEPVHRVFVAAGQEVGLSPLQTLDDDPDAWGQASAHDTLLDALRRYHPEPPADVEEPPLARFRAPPPGWRSMTGCSAAICADAA